MTSNFVDKLQTREALYLALVLGVLFIAVKANTVSRQLRKIPTVGPTGIFGSLYAVSPWSTNDQLVFEGYKKYYGGLFKLSLPKIWNVVVASPELLDDLRRAPDDELSLFFGLGEAFISDMVQGLDPRDHRLAFFHNQAIFRGITRNADTKFPELMDEIEDFFEGICPSNGSNEWTTVEAHKTVSQLMLRLNNRYFVGLPLCRDPEYQSLARKFVINAVVSGLICQYVPTWIRPIIHFFYAPMKNTTRKVMKFTAPIIEERIRMEQTLGPDWKEKAPNDLITWLMQEAPPQQKNTYHITQRVMFTNMASSASLSSTITHGLYQLAANTPQFIAPLREEAERVIGQNGWSKSSLDDLMFMESFARENFRFHGAGVLTLNRMVIKPGGFTFRNGVTVPQGTMISAAEEAIHKDPTYYENPEDFDPYRFLNKDDPDLPPPRISTPDESYLIFGIGRHACPGRFYGAMLIKLIWAYIFLNFEFRLEGEGAKKPPQHLIMGTFFIPNLRAKLQFRRRKGTKA